MRLLVYILIATSVYLLLFFRSWRKQGWKGVVYTLFYIYVCAVIFLTMLPIPLNLDLNRFDGDYGNFIPFRDLKNGYAGALKDILLNVVMMIPLGILVPMIRKWGPLRVVLLGFTSSLFIEGLQLLTTLFGSPYHAFDVTDIISNTAGTIIGYIIYKTVTAIQKDPKNH